MKDEAKRSDTTLRAPDLELTILGSPTSRPLATYAHIEFTTTDLSPGISLAIQDASTSTRLAAQ